MRRTILTVMSAGLVAASVAAPALGQGAGVGAAAAPASVNHDGHGHGMAYVEPRTYGEALRLIARRLSIVQSMVDAGAWDETHADADVIAAAGKALGKLALTKDSGVARPAVKEVNVGGKALAEAATAMHDALNAGKQSEAGRHFERMKTVFAEISKAAPAAYALSIVPAGDVRAGVPTKFALALRDPLGATVQGLEVVHEQPVHVIIAARDLSWYRHEHPARLPDGTFAMELAFPQPGEYTVFADFTPSAKDGGGAVAVGNQVARATVTVAGSPPIVGPSLKLDAAEVKRVGGVGGADGIEVRLRCNGGFKSGEDTVVRYNFQQSGKDVTDFEPYLGAPAHLVIISADGRQYVHAHPVEKSDGPSAEALFAKAASYNNGKDTDLVFHTALPMSGLYRAFLEFKRGGEVYTVPFTIEALAASADHEHDERTEAPRPTASPLPSPR